MILFLTLLIIMSNTPIVPESFLCPITHNIMNNPYIDNDGNTYEYSAITQWLNGNNTSPITRNYLHISHLKPNRSLLELINNFNQNANIHSSLSNSQINNNIIIDNSFILDDMAINLYIDKYIVDEYSYFKLNIDINENNNSPPVDIVALIDISGSMDSSANVEQNGKSIDIGFTILDITKHALNTIIEAMKPSDRISIITFSNFADVICNLTHINNTNKHLIKTQISNLRSNGATNIWAGLNTALDQFCIDNDNNINRVKSLLLLTDGIPSNHCSPPRGILETLDRKLTNMNNNKLIIPNIYTFGFGNNLDTDLLVNIAEKGNGHFSYIPDSGFVGTIFIHSLAYINTLISNKVNIDLEFMCNKFKQFAQILGYDKNNIDLNTLHIGNNRHLIFKILSDDLNKCSDYLSLALKYRTINNEDRIIQVTFEKNKEIILNDNNLNYNIRRLELIASLNSDNNIDLKNNLNIYFNKTNIPSDIYNDLKQINMAVNTYYNSWGKNYIKSFRKAHLEERCNNFKDESIQKYGGQLFNKIKDNIDYIFTNLQPPTPSNNHINNDTNTSYNTKSFSSSFNCASNGCFHENSNVLMYDNKFKKIKDINKGDKLIDINGNYNNVICVVKYICNNNTDLVELDTGTIITPYHPIINNNEWIFPYTIGILKKYNTNYIYNLVLDKGHTIIINSDVCVTLGHNIHTNFVVSHDYFGTDRVITDLKKINGYNEGLVYINDNNIIRSSNNNRVIKIQ